LKGISRSNFINRIHDEVTKKSNITNKFYTDYEEEEETNFWQKSIELEKFIKKPNVMKRYISGELGTNEIYKYPSNSV
jgi:hypothetical protein